MASTLGLSFFDLEPARARKRPGAASTTIAARSPIPTSISPWSIPASTSAALLPLQVGVPLVLALRPGARQGQGDGPPLSHRPVRAVGSLLPRRRRRAGSGCSTRRWDSSTPLGGAVGLPPQRWLTDPDIAIWSVIAVAFWKSFGLNLLIFLAALANVPTDVAEAARIDGAEPAAAGHRHRACR